MTRPKQQVDEKLELLLRADDHGHQSQPTTATPQHYADQRMRAGSVLNSVMTEPRSRAGQPHLRTPRVMPSPSRSGP
jgi:hypothetical protein